mgnify:CR=1 FL=1
MHRPAALLEGAQDVATELEAARWLTYRAASLRDAGQPFLKEASMAKLKATEVAKKTALEGMQMMGGYGYALEYDIERYVRLALVGTIFAGTSEIHRGLVARATLKKGAALFDIGA